MTAEAEETTCTTESTAYDVQEDSLVLIVDDDEDTRDSLRDIIEEEGYTVEVASHGQEALARLANGTKPCFILLDLMMPVMTGIEFLEALRRDPEHVGTPVVLITAWSDQAAMTERVQGFARKPFNLREIFTFIRQYCRCDTHRNAVGDR